LSGQIAASNRLIVVRNCGLSRGWSQGALAGAKPSQRNPKLIWMDAISTTEQVVKEITFREALLPPSLEELR